MAHFIARGRRRGLLVAVVIVLIGIAPLAWYLGSPLFIDRTVDEAFPAATGATAVSPADAPLLAGVSIEEPMAEVPMADGASVEEPMADDAMAEEPMADDTIVTPAAVMPDEPVALSSGAFVGIDAIHSGSGQATIYVLPDGERLLRFTEFEVTNGPDLFVYLSAHPAPRSSAELHEGGAVELGVLKGNIGSQNYVLPSNLAVDTYQSVVIYCKQFSVIFSTAELIASQ